MDQRTSIIAREEPQSSSSKKNDNDGTPPCLLNCSQKSLSDYLLSVRFKDNTLECTKFLLECAASLPGAEETSSSLITDADANPEHNPSSLGEVKKPLIEVSCVSPRGKFQLTVHANGIHLSNQKSECLNLTSSNILHTIVFPKPEDCYTKTKKGQIPNRLVLFVLKNVMFRSKKLSQICVCIPSLEDLIVDIREAIAGVNVFNVPNPMLDTWYTNKVFESESGHHTGMPFVQCYNGVHMGALFPLEEGLLFFKPPLFLPRSELHSIGCGRGSSSSSTGITRYVDMNITLDNGDKTVEFTNIHREELKALNRFIQYILTPAMKKDAGQEEEEENIDEQFDEVQGNNKRKRRGAALEARKATKKDLEESEEEPDSDKEDYQNEDDHESTSNAIGEEETYNEGDSDYDEEEGDQETESEDEDDDDDDDDHPE